MLLSGCSGPVVLMVNNDLGEDATITVRHPKEGKVDEERVDLAEGKADDVYLWHGPPAPWIEVEARTPSFKRVWRISKTGYTSDMAYMHGMATFHAQVSRSGVVLRDPNWLDRLPYYLPLAGGCACCGLPVVLPLLWRRRKGASPR